MISLITGKIGSGKTLYAVSRIVQHLSKGRIVYTNITFNRDALASYMLRRYRVHIVPGQLRYVDIADCASWDTAIDWGSPDNPVLVVLDEIHLFFNARDWAKTAKIHKDMLSFLSQSRKVDVDVLFIAQVASTLEKQFRVQSEWEFACRNVADIQVPFFGTLPLRRMLLVQKDNQSDGGASNVFRRNLLKYDKKLFPVYDTKALLDSHMRGLSETKQRLAPYKLKRPSRVNFRSAGNAFLVGLLVASWAYFRILT